MIATGTVRQPSDSPTVDLSSVFSVTQSGCHLTYYNSQSTTTRTRLFCLQRVSCLDNKLHIYFTSKTNRETGSFLQFFFFPLFDLCPPWITVHPGRASPVQLKLPAFTNSCIDHKKNKKGIKKQKGIKYMLSQT